MRFPKGISFKSCIYAIHGAPIHVLRSKTNHNKAKAILSNTLQMAMICFQNDKVILTHDLRNDVSHELIFKYQRYLNT